MKIEIFYGVVLLVLAIAVFAVAMSLGKLGKEVNRIDSVMTKGLSNLASTVSEVVDKTTSLSDKLGEFEIDPVSKRLEEAKQEVFTEWIDNITKYNPYGGTPHRGE